MVNISNTECQGTVMKLSETPELTKLILTQTCFSGYLFIFEFILFFTL